MRGRHQRCPVESLVRAEPEAIGTLIRLRDRDCAIIGVAPAGFVGHQAGQVVDLWLPMRPLTERRLLESQTMAWYSGVMGRLNPGVTRAQAETELTALYRHIQSLEPPLPPTMRQPPKPSELSLRVRDGAAGLGGLRRQFGEPLTMVLAAVCLVLLIAAINVANLLLARGAARWPELATRMALGASRWRLTRQLTTEGCVIAVGGRGAGRHARRARDSAAGVGRVSWVGLDVSLDRRGASGRVRRDDVHRARRRTASGDAVERSANATTPDAQRSLAQRGGRVNASCAPCSWCSSRSRCSW